MRSRPPTHRTTILATPECIAADTKVSCEDGSFYHADKIFRIGTSLFGTAGHGSMCLVMIEWLKTPKRNLLQLYKHWDDYDRDQIELVEICPGGIFHWDGWGVREKVNERRYAIGSGGVSALAAFDAGATAEDAVRQAMHYDIYTGPPIQVEWLLPPELQKKRRKRG